MSRIKKCPFCKKNIKESSFVSSKNFIAIYNIAPILPGHSMIIPVKHYSKLINLTPELRTEMMELSIEVINMLSKAFKSESYNWTIQDGIDAGQTIDHIHMHIIPRSEGDLPDPGDWYPMLEQNISDLNIDSSDRKRLTKEELKIIVDKIKSYS